MEGGDQENEYIDESANKQKAAEELNEVLAVPEDCNDPAQVEEVAKLQGLIPANFKDLEAAVENLKNAISDDILYNGPTEKIHDTSVIKLRMDLLGTIGAKFDNYITNGSAIEGLNNNLSSHIESLRDKIDEALKTASKSSLQAFIRLHFHCFKNCNKTDCLTMDKNAGFTSAQP